MLKVKFDPPHFYMHRVCCGGCIPDEPPAIALWYYFLMAMQAWKTAEEYLPLEDEPDYFAPYERLYRVAAEVYGCDIERMCNYWLQIDLEVLRLNEAQMRRGRLEVGHMIRTLPEALRLRNGPPSRQLNVKADNPDKWKVRPDA